MKTFTSRITLEKDRKRGASPFYILECPFPSTGTIYLADYIITTTSWKGGITTKSWVSEWGQISEDIGNEQVLTKVSTFSLDVIIDPRTIPNIESILNNPANNIEVTDCFLYLAYHDLLGALETTDPPQLVWSGNIIDWEKLDELTMSLEMVDRSVRLDKYIGTKLSLADYPDAHLDDVGKMMNIIYGANNMVTCLRADWGATTTLKTAVATTETSIELTDASLFPSSGSIVIDTEKISYTGKTGNTLTTCTRGASSTTAAGHDAGAPVWENKTQYDSIIASHACKALTAAYAEIDGSLLRVTNGISYVTSGGKHLLRAASQISVAPSSSLNVSDPSHSHAISVTENKTGTGASIPDTDFFTWSGSASNLIDGSTDTYVQANNYSTDGGDDYLAVTFAAVSGSISAVNVVITHKSNWAGSYHADSGVFLGSINGTRLDMSNTKVTQKIYVGTSAPTTVYVTLNHPSRIYSYQVQSYIYEIYLEVQRSGSATASTGIQVTGGVTYTRLVDKFHCLADGYADDASGTVTGTPNALIERPDHVVKHFLNTYASWALANFYTNTATKFGTTYKFSMVINEYKRLKAWLGKMAWESRCYFRLAPTRAELLLRPDSITSGKTITDSMIAVDDSGRASIRVRRSSLVEVVNKISLHYNRDATKDGDDAYRDLLSGSDATSIARYSENEKPDLFKFDFVQSSAMAQDLLNFYLARLAYRKKIVEMQLFLDNAELEFADGITIAPLANLLCEIIKANMRPGSAKDTRNDSITVIVKEY